MSKNIQFIPLGCPKNDVDSEVIGNILYTCGYSIRAKSGKSSAIFINTCSFIEDAKKESIEHIEEAIAQKRAGAAASVYVAGCLVQRYREELIHRFPEIDGLFGVCDFDTIKNHFGCTQHNNSYFFRYRLTPKHYAYLKIAEGCDYKCSFCAIPMIRGQQHSRTVKSLVEEAHYLVESGVKELIIVAEDITRYGSDLDNGDNLCKLLIELQNVSGLQWIRLLYGYPGTVSDTLISIIADSDKICKYIDIPIQHISDPILRRMNRSYSRKTVEKLLSKLRKRIPDCIVRTSVIVGFPGETKEQFIELSDFLMDSSFDRLGVFMYSDEEGTPAASFDGKINYEEMVERFEEIKMNQEMISERKNVSLLGKNIEVLIDLKDKNQYIGRTYGDAPDIDQIVRVNRRVCVGAFTTITVEKVTSTELIGQ